MKFGFTLEDARRDYPELTDELLEKLQNWAKQHNLPRIPPEKLAIFAHSCYFNVENTIRCMNNFYRLRATSPEIFRNMDPDHETMQRTLDTLCYVNLPVDTPEGYRIVLHRLEDTRPEKYIMDDAIKMFIMMMEIDLYISGCKPGILLLFDASGLRLTHLMRVSLSSLRKLLEYVQEAMPTRLKGIHVLNGVWFMSKVLALVRPFLKKEVYDMIHIYTGDVSDVYQTIPPKCLPQDYGGELCSIQDLRAQFRETMHTWRDQFLEEESLYRSYQAKCKDPQKEAENHKKCTKYTNGEESNINSDDSSSR